MRTSLPREDETHLRPGVVGAGTALVWVLVVYDAYFYLKLVQVWSRLLHFLNSLFGGLEQLL